MKLGASEADVTECHTCDIASFNHKLRLWNGLDLEMRSNVVQIREMCDILRHFVTLSARDQKLET